MKIAVLNLRKSIKWLIIFWASILILMCGSMVLAAEGDETKANNLILLPLVRYTPETGWVAGGMFMYVDNSDSNNNQADTYQGGLIYTQRNQFKLMLGLSKYYQDINRLLVDLSYSKYPEKFFGIGPIHNDEIEEDYSMDSLNFKGSFLYKIAENLYLGPNYRYSYYDMEEVRDDGLLSNGNIIGSDGTRISGAGVHLILDTRDNNFFPQDGSFLELKVNYFSKALGSDQDFYGLDSDFRTYLKIKPQQVLAMECLLKLNGGDVPFQLLPGFGGEEMMRGYHERKYIDKDYFAIQAEYRFPILKRLRGVAFVSVGEVAPELNKFNVNNLKIAGGFGFRYLLDEARKISIRLDLGFSEKGSGLYININEAF